MFYYRPHPKDGEGNSFTLLVCPQGGVRSSRGGQVQLPGGVRSSCQGGVRSSCQGGVRSSCWGGSGPAAGGGVRCSCRGVRFESQKCFIVSGNPNAVCSVCN